MNRAIDPTERKRELKRANNERYRANVRAHRACTVVTLTEEHLQAMVSAGLLPDDKAHLRDAIGRAAQMQFDQFASATPRRFS
ncbi:hypothetical protein GCM10022276_03090 [Sphingomonas limnosediminicola]|uniref:Uncharacterized protein n=1 Tax=Sphingomonas limnosediminicola TaxID=940133 RepID=A0ABP7KTC8_9SPHN